MFCVYQLVSIVMFIIIRIENCIGFLVSILNQCSKVVVEITYIKNPEVRCISCNQYNVVNISSWKSLSSVRRIPMWFEYDMNILLLSSAIIDYSLAPRYQSLNVYCIGHGRSLIISLTFLERTLPFYRIEVWL